MNNVPESSWSGSGPTAEPPQVPPENGDVARWIDENAADEKSLPKTLQYLAALTLPSDPARPDVLVNPFAGLLDEQLWPWNRAAGRLAGNNQMRAAAEINAGLYLALVMLQVKYRQRFHKGMPLCNVGYFLSKDGVTEMPIKCWLLGAAEDALSNYATARGALSFRNLTSTHIPKPALEQFMCMIESRFLRLYTTPLMPESVVDFWTNPVLPSPARQVQDSISTLLAWTGKAYPKLPDDPLALLESVWSRIDLPLGGSR
ncbi:MAG: hypothetical protein IMZ62_01385 [Chloroflexi bacterium]|nr:hypothetical protein [Chloroflexota bacterium]